MLPADFVRLYPRFGLLKGVDDFLLIVSFSRHFSSLPFCLLYAQKTKEITVQFSGRTSAEFNDKVRGHGVKPIDFGLSELLSKMIRLLPEPQQEVVQLTFFEGMSQRQIAAAKCIALGTVKTRLQLAHKKLLNHLVPIQDKVW